MFKQRYLLLLSSTLLVLASHAQSVEETTPGETVERHLPPDEPLAPWAHDPQLLETEAGDKLEVRQIAAERVETVKLANVVPPIRFDSGVADISQTFVDSLRRTLDDLTDRRNVRLHLIGHTDDQPLFDSLARVNDDNAGATMPGWRASVPAKSRNTCRHASTCRRNPSLTNGSAPSGRLHPIPQLKDAP